MGEIKLVFDIGFNEGIYTDHLISLYPDVRVIGIEGHEGYATGKLRFVTPYDRVRPNVKVIHGLVSDKVQKNVPFYICDSNPGLNTLNVSWKETTRHSKFFKQTERVVPTNATTIDRLIEVYGKPDLIKLDIEGAEFLALKGLTQKVGIVTLEWSDEQFDDTLKCVERLKELGYTHYAYTISNERNDLNPNVDGNFIDRYQPDIKYKSWDEFDLHLYVNVKDKDKWGMLYAK
jgi:FkbM family methyltransferase